jgi:hypothetical protein
MESATPYSIHLDALAKAMLPGAESRSVIVPHTEPRIRTPQFERDCVSRGNLAQGAMNGLRRR